MRPLGEVTDDEMAEGQSVQRRMERRVARHYVEEVVAVGRSTGMKLYGQNTQEQQVRKGKWKVEVAELEGRTGLVRCRQQCSASVNVILAGRTKWMAVGLELLGGMVEQRSLQVQLYW